MSFLNKSTSFTRLKITHVPQEILDGFTDKLRQFAFMPIDDNAEEQSFGWTSIEDMEDYAFHNSSPVKEGYFAFSFRLDKRKIAPAVYKKHLENALKEEAEKLDLRGKNYIGKNRKNEIAEQVKLRLLAKTLPVPTVYGVIYSPADGILYLECTNMKTVNLIAKYFLQTLGKMPRDRNTQFTFEEAVNNLESLKDVHLYALVPYNIAYDCIDKTQEKTLKHLVSTAFCDNPLVEGSKDKNTLLGEEFLTWLWYKSEKNTCFQLEGAKVFTSFHVIFENGLSVVGYREEESKLAASVSGKFNPMFEAKRGLQTGKKVHSACLVFPDNAYNNYYFTINAQTFAFSSFTVGGACLDGEDFDAVLFLKKKYMDTAINYLEEAYTQFLACRLDTEKWQEETEHIKNWIMPE